MPKKILIDYREKNSMVPSELINLGFEIEFKELKVADYIIKGIAIERKTISDFTSSMLNGRLLKQLEELKQYSKNLLIVEGVEQSALYDDSPEGINGNAVRGFLLSILLKHNIPIMFTKNAEDTAKFLAVLIKKKQKESPINVKKHSLNKKERMQFILEGFPGVGPKTAKKLLNEFKTLQNIINTPLENLKKIIGKKADIFNIIKEEY
ncbi:MAG: hypothetical protein KKF48_02840 [Nanoarchaeota archaeon]|nr:hypothetical protein [Nanoarchaeota archaeon]MBU1027959.1 hypothetical protein [Nanoarchaeota archaeon]